MFDPDDGIDNMPTLGYTIPKGVMLGFYVGQEEIWNSLIKNGDIYDKWSIESENDPKYADVQSFYNRGNEIVNSINFDNEKYNCFSEGINYYDPYAHIPHLQINP